METFERIHKWDNLKAILMVLVVVGHFANQFDDLDSMKRLALFIYSFHMPLFIFVSGLFSRRWGDGERFSWSRPINFILIGYTLKILIYLTKTAFERHPTFLLFEDTGIPWFMFAMAAFVVMSWLLRRIDWRIVLPAAILLACLAGYSNAIDSRFYLSRILVFFPYYYIGYLVTPDTLRRVTMPGWLKPVALAVLLAAAVWCCINIDDNYSYIRLLTARNPYDDINIEDIGMFHRLAQYAISTVISFAVIVLTPSGANALADCIGARTLQIYFWHRLFLYVIIYSGLPKAMQQVMPGVWIWVYLGIGVLLTLALTPAFWGRPLQWLRLGQDAVGRRISGLVQKIRNK